MGLMTTYDFYIPGEPVAKGRPRFYGYRAVTPQHTRNAEELVRNQFHMFYPHAEPLDGDVMMILMFYKGRHGKPDLDNLEKLVKDALNGLAYVDDQQVKLTLCAMLEPDRMAWGQRAKRLVKRRQGMPLTYGGNPYEPHTEIHIEPLHDIHGGLESLVRNTKEMISDVGNQPEYR